MGGGVGTPTLGIVVARVGEGGGARRGREAEAAILHRGEAEAAGARQQRRSNMLPTGDYFFDLHQPLLQACNLNYFQCRT